MAIRFCTLFDRRYAPRGLVMLESLESYRRRGDDVVVLAMDQESKRTVESVGQGRWRAVTPVDLCDTELLVLANTRPLREFCWTCTPALSTWMLRESREDDIVVYLDADIMFFRDPRILLAELGEQGTILIHEHRFSPDRTSFERSSGRFNVGFVAFRVGAEAKICVERWRAQTFERCELDPENGYCGDQGYLNEWPARHPNLRIMENIGGGVAPWNVNQYLIGDDNGVPTVDGVPVVFFHYHSLKIIDHAFGFIVIEPAYGYDFSSETRKTLFRPYVQRLRRAIRRTAQVGLEIEPNHATWRELVFGLLRARYMFVA